MLQGCKPPSGLSLGSFVIQWEQRPSYEAIVKGDEVVTFSYAAVDATCTQHPTSLDFCLHLYSLFSPILFSCLFLTCLMTNVYRLTHQQKKSFTNLIQHSFGLFFSFPRVPDPHGSEGCQGLTHQLGLLLFTPQVNQRITLKNTYK